MSRGTVDRVVNGRSNVAPAVRERVQKVIREYKVHHAGAAACAARGGRLPHRRAAAVP